jgi:small subunit ribosomal protein S35
MRLCLRAANRRAAAPAKVAPRQYLTTRPFATTPFQRRPAANKDETDDLEDELEGLEEEMEMDPAQLQRALQELRQKGSDLNIAREVQDRVVSSVSSSFSEAMRVPMIKRKDFWNEEETDTDLIIEETGAESFEEDDIMTIAHAKFEEFREYREYARIAAWQMPLLSSKPLVFI